ncbi:MAG: Ig-like domain-containing protein [Thermus sp.]|uniref:Ig-like domain-containing protein n=1 Tax=Thermus sp. TaxID=275 RepID=UPI0030AB44F2
MLSIQTTNGSGEHCFVKGKVRFSAQASGASLVQLFLSTSQNAQAGQLLASGTTSASYTLDTTTIPQGETRYLIAHVQIGSRVVDQVWTIVPDNLAPQLPDVREINDLNNLNLGRWVKGTKTLTLENTELVDNPTPGLASGIKKVTFYAQRIDRDTGEPDGDPVVIGTAASLPYQVNWNTTAVNDGLYHVYAVAEDLLGNKKDAPPYAGFLVSVDNTAPIVSLTVEDNGTGDVANGSDVYAASKGFVSGAAKVIFSANDSGVGVDPSALGLSYTGGSISLTSTSGTVVVDVNHVSGQVTFTFTARDRLGNERSTSQTVTVDNEAPSISRLYLEGQPTVVNAGSQQILNVRATDGISGLEPTSTYVYAGSNASSSATAPFWNATVTTGGLLGLGVVTGDFLNVLIPDPTNEGPSGGTDPLDLIVIVRDRAGNARIDYLTVQVAHTASSDNEVSGGTLTRNTVSGNTEYTVTGVTTLSGTLYVAFFATNSLGLAGVPVGNAPSYLTPSTPIYDLVQTVETPPYRLVSSNSNLFAAGFNSHGHASTTKIQ